MKNTLLVEWIIVLILVLMEDTLRDINNRTVQKSEWCLNPCFNGRYSQRDYRYVCWRSIKSLNPCFNGRYSQSAKTYVSLYTSIWGMLKLLEMLLLT